MHIPKAAAGAVAIGFVAGSLALTGPAIATDTGDDPGSTATQVPDPGVTASATIGKNGHVKAQRAWRKIKIIWDWNMPDGIPATDSKGIPQTPMQPVPGYQQAGNALYGPLPDGANGSYAVNLDATKSTGQGNASTLKCTWVIGTTPATTLSGQDCSKPATTSLPEGNWPLTLTVLDTGSNTSKTVQSSVTVKNVLMSVSGDSYASGEGYPPFTNADGTIDWDEPACDRSRWSGFVRAAAFAEQSDPHTNVTLVDVACSGGQILQNNTDPAVSKTGGMLSPQKKIVQPSEKSDSGPRAYMPAQIDQLSAIAQGKNYDVTLFSVGGNDAGLSPIVESCAIFDGGSVALSNVWTALGTPGGQTVLFDCTDAGQAEVIPDVADPVKSTFICEPSGTTGIFALLGSCLDGGVNPPLREAIDTNLTLLQEHYALLAPCFGAGGGAATCKTQKIVNNAPGGPFTATDPVVIKNIATATQAMYPDLTQRQKAGGDLAPCSVQEDPTKPWGGAITLDPTDPFNFSKYKLGPNLFGNPIMSPLNQIDNTWVLKALYEGKIGVPYTLPTSADFPNNVPLLQDPQQAQYTPTANGILTQVQDNRNNYGWAIATSMYNASHPHGACSSTRWITDMTDYIELYLAHGKTGAGLHPNEAGQAQYGDMLGPVAVGTAGLPITRQPTSVVPLGASVSSTSKGKVAKHRVKPRGRVRIKVTVSATQRVNGQIAIRGGNSTNSRLDLVKTGQLKATGNAASKWVKLPKKWTKLPKKKNKGMLRLRTQFLGNISVKVSHQSPPVKVRIRRP
jgi:hypothetical protein